MRPVYQDGQASDADEFLLAALDTLQEDKVPARCAAYQADWFNRFHFSSLRFR